MLQVKKKPKKLLNALKDFTCFATCQKQNVN